MDESSDHADVRILPPLLFLGSILLGVIANFLVPLGFAPANRLRLALGLLLVAAGFAAGGWAFAWIRRTQQDPDPRTPTPELILGGPFRYSRNPIYLGMALIQAGAGVALGNAWVLALLVPTVWIAQRYVIEREEDYLARKFGEPYAAFRRSVRRWI